MIQVMMIILMQLIDYKGNIMKKHKKTFNGYLPRVDIDGTFDNPNYSVILQVPVRMERGYDKRNEYDCLVDPFEEFTRVLNIASILFDVF